MAADYLGICKTTFLDNVDTGIYPKPVQEGRRKLWARVQLDRFVASQFGIAPASEDDPSWADLD